MALPILDLECSSHSWYLYKMEAQNMLRKYDVKYFFSKKDFGFDDSFHVAEYLQQIEMHDVFHMCA